MGSAWHSCCNGAFLASAVVLGCSTTVAGVAVAVPWGSMEVCGALLVPVVTAGPALPVVFQLHFAHAGTARVSGVCAGQTPPT